VCVDEVQQYEFTVELTHLNAVVILIDQDKIGCSFAYDGEGSWSGDPG
jgi:hypothetical protein